jgi:hypothetical protein
MSALAVAARAEIARARSRGCGLAATAFAPRRGGHRVRALGGRSRVQGGRGQLDGTPIAAATIVARLPDPCWSEDVAGMRDRRFW